MGSKILSHRAIVDRKEPVVSWSVIVTGSFRNGDSLLSVLPVRFHWRTPEQKCAKAEIWFWSVSSVSMVTIALVKTGTVHELLATSAGV